MKVALFIDQKVGLECLKFILKNYLETIHYIVVVDKNSDVYQYLVKSSLYNKKVMIYKDTVDGDFDVVDYMFLLWWPFIMNQKFLNLAKKGVINTHPSLLPYNRGKHYNFWNLVEEVPFGVTLHFVTHRIDDGDILFQEKIEKTWEDTGKSLYEKAQKSMIVLFISNYKNILDGKYKQTKQNLKVGSFHNSSELEKASEIFLDKEYTARNLLNLLRARTFLPYDGCHFYENGEKFEIEIKIKKKEYNEQN